MNYISLQSFKFHFPIECVHLLIGMNNRCYEMETLVMVEMIIFSMTEMITKIM